MGRDGGWLGGLETAVFSSVWGRADKKLYYLRKVEITLRGNLLCVTFTTFSPHDGHPDVNRAVSWSDLCTPSLTIGPRIRIPMKQDGWGLGYQKNIIFGT